MNLGSESEFVEYKKTTSELKEGIASIASILNKHGEGELYFGVKNNGDVCGMQVSDNTLREIGQTIDQSIEPRIHPTIEKFDDGEGREYIRVKFWGDDPPYSCKGVFRLRVSDSDVLLSASEVKRMSVKSYHSEHPWDEELNEIPLSSVEEDTLKNYIERGNECGRITFEYTGVEDALVRLGLARDDKLTNAAAVLFCKPRTVMLKMAIFATDARINILDMKQEQECLFKMAAMAEDYVMRNIKWRFIIDGSIEREEVPEIPRAVVREAVMNAFCHRDYTSRLAVQVDIFGEKVEIFSPGWFPDGTTPEALLADDAQPFSQSPNQLLANALYRCKAIESYETGLKRIKARCEDSGVRFEYQTVDQGTIVRFFRPDWFEDVEIGNERDALSKANRVSRADRIHKREEVALRLAKESGRVTTALLVDATGASRRTASTTLKKLADSGQLQWHGTGSSDPSQYYTLK